MYFAASMELLTVESERPLSLLVNIREHHLQMVILILTVFLKLLFQFMESIEFNSRS
jgi:hypothetical protein